MSVFKNIKGTIQSVQQDISSSIKSLTTSSKDKDKDVTVIKKSRSAGVNLDAGADLLHRYQENWSELNQQAEENASKAENLAVLIGSLFVRYSRQSDQLTQLKEEAGGLPTVLQQLQDLTNQIARVEELCEQVEAAEIQLENICEVQEFKKAETTHQLQLAAYKDKKRSDVERYKVSLAEQHAKNVKFRDMKRQAQLKERQSIFQEAFDKDINYYRTFGHTERQQSFEQEKAEDKLAEIQIEEDNSVLDNFLESTEVTPSNETPPVHVLTHEEMPDDESDSGVINDRSESPDNVPSSLPYSEKDDLRTGTGDSAEPDSVSDNLGKIDDDKPVMVQDCEGKPKLNQAMSSSIVNEEKTEVMPCGNLTENAEMEPDNLATELAKAESRPVDTVKENGESTSNADTTESIS